MKSVAYKVVKCFTGIFQSFRIKIKEKRIFPVFPLSFMIYIINIESPLKS